MERERLLHSYCLATDHQRGIRPFLQPSAGFSPVEGGKQEGRQKNKWVNSLHGSFVFKRIEGWRRKTLACLSSSHPSILHCLILSTVEKHKYTVTEDSL